MANPFDQFDATAKAGANPFDQFDTAQAGRDANAKQDANAALSRIGNIAKGGVVGLADLGGTIINGAVGLAGKLSPDLAQWNRSRNAEMDYIKEANPSAEFKAGRVGGNIAATWPVGGLLGQGVKALSQAPKAVELGNALASGGFSTGTAPVNMLSRAGLENALTRTAGGAVTGGASTVLVDPDHAGTGAAVGGVLPTALSLAGKAGGYIGNGLKSLVQPFTTAGQEAIAGKIVNKFAEGGPTAINNAALVPGSVPTLAEATGNSGLATLQRGMRDVQPNAFAEREATNAGARNAAFDKAAGDSSQLDFYRTSRAQAADDLYGKALDQSNAQEVTPYIKGQITQLLKRPSINEASKTAQKLALERGEKPAEAGSLRALHDVKTALDDKISEAVRAGKGGEAASLQDTKSKLLDVMEKLSPAYGEARVTYAQMSQPVNAMETLQGLRLTDAKGNITLSKIQGALDGLERKMSGPGTDAAKSLTGEQLNTLKAIRDDLLRQSNLSAGKSIGSNTFQNIATDNIISTMLPGKLGGFAEGKVGGLAGQIGKLAYSGPNEAIRNRLADMMLQPELAKNALNPAVPQLGNFRKGLNALADRTAPSVYRAAPLLSSDRR